MDQACQKPATQDLVGIGVRIGFYCQWVAALTASLAVPSEVSSIQTMVISLQSAILAALILVTARGTLQPQEVPVILWLAFGGFLATHVHSGAPGAGTLSLSRLAAIIQVLGALVGYSTWFWWKGVLALESGTCRYATFAFARVEVIRLRYFAISVTVLSAVALLLAEALLLSYLILVFVRDPLAVALRNILRAELPLPNQLAGLSKWKYQAISALRVVSMVYAAVTVELTIKWCWLANADNLEEVGQLIPLVVGVTGMIKVFYYWVRDWDRSRAMLEGMARPWDASRT